MEQIFASFINNASVFEKGVFLMASGLVFVFFVQLVFYLTVRLWPRGKK